MRALILSAQGVQDQEFIYPFYRLKEAGYEVDVVAREPVFTGIQGVKIEHTTARVHGLYGLMVIPGGVKAMEKLRLDHEYVNYVRNFYLDRGVVASICSGAQMLISAGIVKGRKIAAYPAMKTDVENAGAIYVNDVVVDERLVTAPHYRDLGPWMRAVFNTLENNRPWVELCCGL